MDILKTENYKLSIGGVNDYPDVEPTDGEAQMFEYIKSVCPAVEIQRKASGYVTAVYGETDVARFKFTERAKWVMFPYLEDKSKRRIENVEEMANFDDEIAKSFEFAVQTENYTPKKP